MYGAVADTRVQYVLLGFSEKYHHIYRFTTSQFLHIFLDNGNYWHPSPQPTPSFCVSVRVAL